MMNHTTIKTDNRLITILRGSIDMRTLLDPDGIALNSMPDMVVLDTKKSKWKIRLLFSGGDALWLHGTNGADEGLWIESLMMTTTEGKEKVPIPCTRSRTLMESLGNLGEIPIRLRRLLGVPTLPDHAPTESERDTFIENYVQLIDKALMWEVEMKSDTHSLERFAIRKMLYTFNEKKEVTLAKFSAVCELPEGRIILSADADVYGLGNKRVIIEKNLGMLRSAVIECRENHEKRYRPSLKTAFDLYHAIPLLYGSQRSMSKRRK